MYRQDQLETMIQFLKDQGVPESKTMYLSDKEVENEYERVKENVYKRSFE